jgi:hypothetical protein
MSNFISVQEASAFFYSRGYVTIHHMGDGRIMSHYDRFLREESIVHIMPKYEDGVVAYEITADQLQDMLERRVAA